MWDERYSGEDYCYGTKPNDFLVSVRSCLPASGRALCLAEGEGRNAVYLAGEGFDVVAMDQSPVGMAKAQRLARTAGVSIETRVAGLETFDIEPGAWDVIVSIWAHVPSALRRRVHAAVVGGLVPGGVFVLEAYTPAQLALGTGGPKSADLLMTLDALRAELSGLEFVHAAELKRDVFEGAHHGGTSSVVQVVARRPR